MLKQRQHGQALVGVLVVMILVFLLAGAVSIGASSLMARMGNHGQAVAEDFAAQSAVAAAASYAASTSSCVGNIADFTVAQPSPGPQAGRCAGLSGVPLNSLNTKDLGQWSGDCSATNLTSYQNSNLVIFFNARWLPPSIPGHTMSAYIDKFQATSRDPCSTNPAPGNAPCSAAKPDAGVSPLVLPCNLTAPPTGTLWYLIVRNAAAQPRQVFFLSYTTPGIQSNTGTLYVTVAGTGLPTPRDFEQAIFYSPSKGAPLQLLYEAQLP
jgi:hypothetical protein